MGIHVDRIARGHRDLPALARAKEKAKRINCLSNLKQIGLASQIYALDHEGHLLTDTIGQPPNTWINGEDDLSWCYPDLVPALNAFICRSTRNNVRTNLIMIAGTQRRVVLDLLNNAAGGKLGANGHSYEVLGSIRDKKVTQSFVSSYPLEFHPTLKGVRPGPSAFWLFHDSDDAGKNVVWDTLDGHGAEGGNVAYCDGHANWVTTKQRITEWQITRDLVNPVLP